MKNINPNTLSVAILLIAVLVLLMTLAYPETEKLDDYSKLGQWLQFLFGVPISALLLIVTYWVADSANKISDKHGELEALNFAHDRLTELNNTSILLASKLESLHDALNKCLIDLNEKHRKAISNLSEKNLLDRGSYYVRAGELDEEAIISELTRQVLEDENSKSLRSQVDIIVRSLPEAYKQIIESPFSLAALRVKLSSSNFSKEMSDLKRVFEKGWIGFEIDPLSVARGLLDKNPANLENIMDVFMFSVSGRTLYLSDYFLLGMTLGYTMYRVVELENEKKVARISELKDSHSEVSRVDKTVGFLFNDGVASMSVLLGSLPDRESIESFLGQFLPNSNSAIKYSKATVADSFELLGKTLTEAWKHNIKFAASESILVLVESYKSGRSNYYWRPYEETLDGEITDEKLVPIFYTPREFVRLLETEQKDE